MVKKCRHERVCIGCARAFETTASRDRGGYCSKACYLNIERKIEHDPATGCWNWPLDTADSHHGYARFRRGGRAQYVHRYMWERDNGPIPDGLEIDHLCLNRRCVNPAHLEAVTRHENIVRQPQVISARARNHCAAGHEMAGANLYVAKSGTRVCKACKRANSKRNNSTSYQQEGI